MKRTDGANATAGNLFQDADAGIGQKATSQSADWMNNVQEELATPIEASGRTLDGTKHDQLMKSIIDLTYAIGDYIYTENDASGPGVRFPWQTWVEVKGVVLVGRDTAQTEFNATGKTGGEKTHELTTDEIPDLTPPDSPVATDYRLMGKSIAGQGTTCDGYDSNGAGSEPNVNATAFTGDDGKLLGGGQPHNNLQPYRVVRMWRRTA